MSGVQDITCWWVGVCKLTHTRTSLYIFKQQRSQDCSTLYFFFVCEILCHLKKEIQGFCLGNCLAFALQRLWTKAKRGKYATDARQCQLGADVVQRCSSFRARSLP